jgi:hypothetical protein
MHVAFYVGPLWDYISGTEQNQIRTKMESGQVNAVEGLAVECSESRLRRLSVE